MKNKIMTKNIKFIGFFLLLFLGVWSCNSSEDFFNTPEIKTEDYVQLFVGDSRNLELKGGNQKYEVSSENPLVAKSSLVDGWLKIDALGEGETNIIVKSGTTQKKVHVSIRKTAEIGIFSKDKTIASFVYSLQTENELWLMDATNPADAKKIAFVNWNSQVKVGDNISLNIKKSDFPEFSAGTISSIVDFVTGDKVGLKVGEITLILPKN
ncbi:hypothetical protein EDM00_02820 [Ornithobacterium rhinotracheale]|nr:hypothetical protein [Ornithobacterium rhinotracheale]MRJ08347.1 hypothetical protein [Ornithobacterium rhinotracheale]